MTTQITTQMPIPKDQAQIFVADHDRSIAEMIQDLLQEAGYSASLLQLPKNAYEEITRTLPDLVILDITLYRRGDGWLTLHKLKQNPLTASMPVVICSADIRGLRAREEDLRVMGYPIIEKPFDIDELIAAVQEGLAGRHPANKIRVKQNPLYSDIVAVDGVTASMQRSMGGL